MATADTNKFESLPWELLENVFERLPVPDVLKLKQVNRGFHDLIRNSLRIQHKLDLCATGLEPNWATSITVADSIKALEEYRSRWANINVNRSRKPAHTLDSSREATAGGVYGVATEDEIQLFTLPSNPRGIRPIKQTISVDFSIAGFAFHPQADVVVVAEQTGHLMRLRLLTISGDVPHPLAHERTLECFTGQIDDPPVVSLSITSWRLASVVENRVLNVFRLSVWNWRTGERLFEHDTTHYKLLEFLDDYRLAIELPPSPDSGRLTRLLVLDVERAPSSVPTQTWFHGPASSPRWTWTVEAGGYKPSPQDTLHAPFRPDPSQRILALSLDFQKGFLVLRAETLLRLARERAGGKIQWREWSPYLFETSLGSDFYRTQHVKCWVSGFRLFRVSFLQTSSGCSLHVYDFSPHARAKFLQHRGNSRQLMHPSVAAYRFPWGIVASFGHDGMVFRVRPGESSTETHIHSI